jgi:hypothetical protein
LALAILFRNRKKLQDSEFEATYGFVYLGLADHAFYWEILLHFRKIMIISINVFFTTFVSLYRVYIYLIILTILGIDRIHVDDSLHRSALEGLTIQDPRDE